MAKIDEITLDSGRAIHLRSISQDLTYGGLLEGWPTAELNQRIIDRTVRRAREADQGREPYLLTPVQTPMNYHSDRPYPFGEPASIPSIIVVAEFRCSDTARDPDKDYSDLTIIWFQDEWAFPIASPALEALQQIDWERHAHDWEWG
jgi:hypothetical protein